MGFGGGRDLGAVLLHSLLRTRLYWILCLFHKEVPLLQYSSSITNSLTVVYVPAVRGQCMQYYSCIALIIGFGLQKLEGKE